MRKLPASPPSPNSKQVLREAAIAPVSRLTLCHIVYTYGRTDIICEVDVFAKTAFMKLTFGEIGRPPPAWRGAPSGVGIYIRKQESKKTRKQELDQESDQEKKKFFPFFLGRFLGRERVFILFF